VPHNDVVIEAFTELAPRYEETVDRELRRFWGTSYAELADRLLELVSLDGAGAVLDVATGTGFIPRRLAKTTGAKHRIVGLDITPAVLERGRRIIDSAGSSARIELVCASATTMPLAAGVFDAVICGLGTHHMHVPQLLSEVKRVLRPGGRVIMADMGASPFLRSFWGTALLKIVLTLYNLSPLRAQAEQEALPNIWTGEEWRTVLSDLGFVEIEITESSARYRWIPGALIIRAVANRL